mgnify:CR=1 FL=1
MSVVYLKAAGGAAGAPAPAPTERVAALLSRIAEGGAAATRACASELDGWQREIVVPAETRATAAAALPGQVKADIRFAHDNIRRFAEAQRATIRGCEVELSPGLVAGQRHIPVQAVGCYVPGGRYAHVASALMTITTARVAGVPHVAAVSPPRGADGIPAPVLYAMDLAGADTVLTLGGVQAVAALAHGHFGLPPADMIVGPGNAYVAEAKRLLFGQIGIDMVAGPTDSLVLADDSADAEVVAADLVSQAEHGASSPVWLVTDSRALGEAVAARVPALIDALPEANADAARLAWTRHGEIALCADREEMAALSDRYAPEHLHVQARDLDWWLGRLTCYGSLFLGDETTVAFGDKTAGPNHVLPTARAARYTGGLSVQKFLKTVTWQRASPDASARLAGPTARLSRLEGMEGHARAADLRAARHGVASDPG